MLNRHEIIGRLGQDPDIKTMASGNKVANLSVATSERWKDRDGNKQEKTQWHKVTIFGGLADIAERFLRKGSLVYLAGQIETRKWTDQSGQDRWTTETVLKQFGGELKMLDGQSGGQSEPRSNDGGGEYGDYGPRRDQDPTPPRNNYQAQGDLDDEIPF